MMSLTCHFPLVSVRVICPVALHHRKENAENGYSLALLLLRGNVARLEARKEQPGYVSSLSPQEAPVTACTSPCSQFLQVHSPFPLWNPCFRHRPPEKLLLQNFSFPLKAPATWSPGPVPPARSHSLRHPWLRAPPDTISSLSSKILPAVAPSCIW